MTFLALVITIESLIIFWYFLFARPKGYDPYFELVKRKCDGVNKIREIAYELWLKHDSIQGIGVHFDF